MAWKECPVGWSWPIPGPYPKWLKPWMLRDQDQLCVRRRHQHQVQHQRSSCQDPEETWPQRKWRLLDGEPYQVESRPNARVAGHAGDIPPEPTKALVCTAGTTGTTRCPASASASAEARVATARQEAISDLYMMTNPTHWSTEL